MCDYFAVEIKQGLGEKTIIKQRIGCLSRTITITKANVVCFDVEIESNFRSRYGNSWYSKETAYDFSSVYDLDTWIYAKTTLHAIEDDECLFVIDYYG